MADARPSRLARFALLAPWAGSLAVHALFAGSAAAVVAALVSQREAPQREVSVSFDDVALAGNPEVEAREDEPREFAQRAAMELPASTLDAPPAALAPAPARVDEAPAEEVGARALPGLASTLPSSDIDAGSLATAPEFFGARGSSDAMRIVYVVDASGSMLSALPVVVEELERSIDQLAEIQWFQVLFFHDDRVLAARNLPDGDSDGLVRATHDNKRAVMRWVRTVRASRAADPLPALEHALDMRPDVIFLLSKGMEETEAVASTSAGHRRITQRNRDALARLNDINPSGAGGVRRVAIKVLHFMDDDRGGLLAAIGRLHGGDDGYTFLSRERLGL